MQIKFLPYITGLNLRREIFNSGVFYKIKLYWLINLDLFYAKRLCSIARYGYVKRT